MSLVAPSRPFPTARRRRLRRVAVAIAVSVGGVTGSALVSAPPVSAAPDDTPLAGLREGTRGDAVRTLQQRLIANGVSVRGGADGVFGPATRSAVTSFQRWNGLPVTGRVDPATAQRLVGTADAQTAGSSTSGDVVLSQGARGPAVTELQRQLAAKGVFVAGGADGVYGPATTRAVTQFQRWNGLGVTGTVTPATSRALGLGSTSPSASTGSGTTASSSSSSVSSSNPYVGLRQGSSGPRVTELQKALQSSGLVVRGGADGVFGPATATTLRAFEQVNGLTRDAVVGEREATLLGLGSGSTVSTGRTATATATSTTSATSSSGSSSGSGTNGYVGLKRGDSGSKVTELQKALQSLGFVIRGGASGTFDGSTQYVLRSFQSVNGIAQTGVVSAKGARILKLGQPDAPAVAGSRSSGSGGGSSASIRLDRFPVQGLCFFGDTWHAARGNGRVHEGVDIIAPEGKLIYAVADGTITTQYYDQPGRRSGNGLKLTKADGTYFVYLHMQGVAKGVEVGTKVKAGDVLGTVGNTGSSATAHVHFEIHPWGGAAINPYPTVKAMDQCRDTSQKWQATYL